MILGILLIFLLSTPTKVTRADGTPVTLAASTHWRTELKGVVMLLGDWRMVLLAPMFLGSNWFYAYQFGINAIYFDVPTRALNGTMYWYDSAPPFYLIYFNLSTGLAHPLTHALRTAQIFGAILMGQFLDSKLLSRRGRALAGLAITGVLLSAVWAGGLAFQLGFKRGVNLGVGWSDIRYPGPFVLYFSYGMMDAVYQVCFAACVHFHSVEFLLANIASCILRKTYCYWLMGTLTNDAAVLGKLFFPHHTQFSLFELFPFLPPRSLRRVLQGNPVSWWRFQFWY